MSKILAFLAVVVVVVVIVVLARTETPVLSVAQPVSFLGQATPVTVHVKDKRGLRVLRAWVEQSGTRTVVAHASDPNQFKDADWKFAAGVQSDPQLKDGNATLVVEAVSNDVLRRPRKTPRFSGVTHCLGGGGGGKGCTQCHAPPELPPRRLTGT